ncbi:MAG: peptidoglycan recognition protein family protein [Methylobacter sp.]
MYKKSHYNKRLSAVFIFIATTLGFPTTSPAGPSIVSRASWGAQPAIEHRHPLIKEVNQGHHLVAAENSLTERKQAIYLTVHHTARKASKDTLATNLKDFQKQMFGYTINYGNGRSKRIYLGDIPYHYFIDRNGEIGEGRELKFAAYSNTLYKTPIENHITVVLDGNFESSRPTKNQIASLTNLLEYLSNRHNIKLENIKVHIDVAPTNCPGNNLRSRMADIYQELANRGIK